MARMREARKAAAPSSAADAEYGLRSRREPRASGWTHDIIARNRESLAAEARAAVPASPVEQRHYFEIIDGRMTWQNRVPIEQALLASWYEVDAFCRVREADAAMREAPPLDEAALAPYHAIYEVAPPKPPAWKRLLGAR